MKKCILAIVSTLLLISSASAQEGYVPSAYCVETQERVRTGRLGILFPRHVWSTRRWIVYDPNRISVADLRRLRLGVMDDYALPYSHRWIPSASW